MGVADAAGAGDAANELLPIAAVGDADGLDAAGGNLDAAGVWRAGELCALADVNGPSASIAQAINGMVNFITTLSWFRLISGPSGTHGTLSGGHIEVSARLDSRVTAERLFDRRSRRQQIFRCEIID